MTEQAKKNIYQRIHAVMEKVDYVQKEAKKNGMQYSFVKHDAVTAAIRPHLVDEKVVYFPQNMEHTQDGNRTEVTLDLCFVCADNPEDQFIVPSFGYGIDSQDKGPGKAISYAVKYALLKTFGLETGDDPENDNIDHKKKPEPVIEPKPDFNEVFNTKEEIESWPKLSIDQANEKLKLGSARRMTWLSEASKLIDGFATPEDVVRWKTANVRHVAALGQKQREAIESKVTARLKATSQAPQSQIGDEPNDEIPFEV